jgi:PHD/YefM family antitoxin component YafN of YafNO toxin-antitoxin module
LQRPASVRVLALFDPPVEPTAVIVPIFLWREIESERETVYLLRSKAMKRRLLRAKQRQQGLSLDQTVEKLGI